MDQACDLAAFRIIQESLTNASKHGADAKTDVRLTYAAGSLTITISNHVHEDPAGSATEVRPPGPPCGHGLMGMHERAVACGGSLTARRDSHGVFCVAAVIPHRPVRPPGSTAAASGGPTGTATSIPVHAPLAGPA